MRGHRTTMAGKRVARRRETEEERGLAERSKERRKRIVGHIAHSWEEAEQWDLEFWQNQTPQMRLSALVAMRNDLAAIHGRNKKFDWDD